MRNPRSIALCLLLCLLTSGIFSLIWLYLLASDMEKLAPDTAVKAPSVLVLSCLTCFLYDFYWLGTVVKILQEKSSGESYENLKFSLITGRLSLGFLIFLLGFFTMGMLWGFAMFSSVLMLGRIQKEMNVLSEL